MRSLPRLRRRLAAGSGRVALGCAGRCCSTASGPGAEPRSERGAMGAVGGGSVWLPREVQLRRPDGSPLPTWPVCVAAGRARQVGPAWAPVLGDPGSVRARRTGRGSGRARWRLRVPSRGGSARTASAGEGGALAARGPWVPSRCGSARSTSAGEGDAPAARGPWGRSRYGLRRTIASRRGSLARGPPGPVRCAVTGADPSGSGVVVLGVARGWACCVSRGRAEA